MTRAMASATIGLLIVCAACPGAPPSSRKPRIETQVPVETALAKKLPTFKYSGSFATALDRLGRASGLRIVADWKMLELAGAKRDKKVSVSAKGARAEQVLDLILARAAAKGSPLGWSVEGKSIRIAPQQGVLQRRWKEYLSKTTPRTADPIRQHKAAPPTFDFNETPLEGVVEFFRKLTGANFYVNWKALEEVGVTRETPVTLQIANVPIGRALTLVTDQLTDNLDKYRRVYWVVDDGIIFIAPGSALNTRMRTRTYDLGTLMFRPMEIRADQRELTGNALQSGAGASRSSTGATVGGSSSPSASPERRQGQGEEDALVGIIRRAIGEDMWQPQGKGSIRVHGNRLIVTQTLLGYKLLEDSLRVH
jgi:hypothetical protein